MLVTSRPLKHKNFGTASRSIRSKSSTPLSPLLGQNRWLAGLSTKRRHQRWRSMLSIFSRDRHEPDPPG